MNILNAKMCADINKLVSGSLYFHFLDLLPIDNYKYSVFFTVHTP